MPSMSIAAVRSKFQSTSLRHYSAALIHHKPSISHCRFSLRSSFSIRMSTSDSNPNPNPNQIVEHIVLFKVKADVEPSAISAMLSNLNGLSSLDSVLYISAGAVSRCRSNTLTFTHMLHSRYRNKTDLTAYAEHPAHVGVVSNFVRPIVEDVMAVDWIADDLSGSVDVPPGSALRLTVMKLKDDAGAIGKSQVLETVRGIREKFTSIKQLTAGENFSAGRNKGFSICSIAVFNKMKELEELDSQRELVNDEKDKVREFLDGVVVLDYAPVPAASL